MTQTIHPRGFRFGANKRSAPAKPYLSISDYVQRPSVVGRAMAKIGLISAVPTPPAEIMPDFSKLVLGMHLNDHEGTCVPGAEANRIEIVEYLNGTPVTIADADVQAAYEAVGGFDPNNPVATDQGCDPTVFEQYLVDHGMAGHKTDDWAAVDLSNGFNLLKCAIDWFGAVKLDVVFPAGYTFPGVWDAPPAGWQPGARHMVVLSKYDATYFYDATWNYWQPMTPAFLSACVDMAVIGLSKDMIAANGKTWGGLDYQALLADMNGQYGIVPAPPPPPAPINWWNKLSTGARVGVIAGAGAALALVYLLLKAIPIT